MKKYLLLVICSGFTCASIAQQKVTLPNGWSLTPAGTSLRLGDLPLNIAVSASQRLMAVTNNGQGKQSLQLIDVKKETVIDNISIQRAWLGLKFSRDEKFLYVGAGNDNQILKYAVKDGKLVLQDSIVLGKKWPNKISPAGLDIDDDRDLMYVVTKDNNSVYVVDLKSKETVKKVPINGEGYTCLLSPDKKELYVSCWGCDKLVIFNTSDMKMLHEIPVGDNPNELCLTKDGSRLFVANANDNSVSVINVQQRKVTETLSASLYPNDPPGSTTNGLALSADEHSLFIANADNNSLAVFDVSNPGESSSRGFIPVGWYPTCVRVVKKKIFVTNGKGFSSFPNPKGPSPVKRAVKHQAEDDDGPQYIGGLMKGTMSIINIPSDEKLDEYSKQVYLNSPYNKELNAINKMPGDNPIPQGPADVSPIKHVFYIIKENRTYDQVLGDVKGGNGDTSLLLFGEKYTPNLHKLVKDFVLLDNFYVDGEVSADGHNWSMGAYATDYLEKNWVTSYGGRGGEYDAEGTRGGAN
ncbi:MAG TPA: glutaminyl-peptide cyclotransferase, partial [Ferruginibacter sp.]|nr:glutaminyl-peptide cyclotransferase [Ferruginibacter sp.]